MLNKLKRKIREEKIDKNSRWYTAWTGYQINLRNQIVVFIFMHIYVYNVT